MKTSRDTEYQDPSTLGSLSRALQMYLTMRDDGQHTFPQRITFTILCPSEARANRLARFLCRRLACGTADVSQLPGPGRDGWQVTGSTIPELQSLRGLERLSTWLRLAADSHQVRLVRVDLVQAAA